MTFSPRKTVIELLPEPAVAMAELEQLQEKVARETIQFLTYLVEEELDDLYALHSAMIEFNESVSDFHHL